MVPWLKTAALVAKAHRTQFSLVYFDIKDGGDNPSANVRGLRRLARKYLPRDLNVVYSVADASDATEYFSDIRNDLRPNEGLTIDHEDDPHEVVNLLERVSNKWYGNGTYAYGNATGIFKTLKHAAALRDNDTFGIKKTCVWTLNEPSSIHKFVNKARVDAVMVPNNKWPIQDALKVLDGTVNARRSRRHDQAFFRFDPGEAGVFGEPSYVWNKWGWFPPDFLPVDAAFFWPVEGDQVEGRTGNAVFFKNHECIFWTPWYGKWFRAPIEDAFRNWPKGFWPITAAIYWPVNGKGYFFSGADFIRYVPYKGPDADRLDVAQHWKGWPTKPGQPVPWWPRSVPASCSST
jgi:hypothetical protein